MKTGVQKYTLTIIFDRSMQKVLMCDHKKFGKLNYIGGKVDLYETNIAASYRELEEETGISPEDVTLHFVREEIVNSTSIGDYHLYITTGRLDKHYCEVILKEETNPLMWLDIKKELPIIIQDSYGNGNCYTFLREAINVVYETENVTESKSEESKLQIAINALEAIVARDNNTDYLNNTIVDMRTCAENALKMIKEES